MKPILLFLLGILLSSSAFSQSKNSFKYQAVLRNDQGVIIENQSVKMKVSILSGTENTTVIYAEEHSSTTNEFGLILLNIGEGEPHQGLFENIDWTQPSYAIQLEVDLNDQGYTTMGTAPLLSVPFAMHAETVSNSDDADADPQNEIQTLSLDGNTLSLTDGGSVIIPVQTSLDGDVSGELSATSVNKIKGREIAETQPENGQILKWNAELKQWTPSIDEQSNNAFSDGVASEASFSGTETKTLTISRSNDLPELTANFTDEVNDADSDPENELQDLSLEGNVLSLSKSSQTITIPTPGWGDLSDEALFAVVNYSGDTVFAVYQGGVRICVDESPTKSARGGFAVAGINSAGKGTTNEFLRVTSDSVRIYVDESESKAARGGFAVAGINSAGKGTTNNEFLRVTPDSVRIYLNEKPSKAARGGFAVAGINSAGKGNENPYFNVNTNVEAETINAESRIVFYPSKDAFMAGTLTILSPDSVGANSANIGFQNIAKGQYSQAFGYQSTARGNYSMAVGKNALAAKINSFAFGEDAKALGEESYAFGRGAKSLGYRSFAFGSTGADSAGMTTPVTQAKGDYSFAIGQGSITGIDFENCPTKPLKFTGTQEDYYNLYYSGTGAVAIGMSDSSLASYATTIGYYNTAGYGAVVLGYKNKANTSFASITGGYSNIITGSNSTIGGGKNNSISGSYAFIGGGIKNTIESDAAWGVIGGGYQNQVFGSTSSILNGSYNTTNGALSAILSGAHNVAQSYCETVVGLYNDYDIAGDSKNWLSTDHLFVVGNGTSEGTRSNAMVIYKNGNTDVNGNLYINHNENTTDGLFISNSKNSGSNWHFRVNSNDNNLELYFNATLMGIFNAESGAYELSITPEKSIANINSTDYSEMVKKQQKTIEMQQKHIEKLEKDMEDLKNMVLQLNKK
jgi:hypothetical protein